MSHSLLHIKGKTAVDGVLKSVTVSVNKTLGTIDGVYIDQEPPEKNGEMIDSCVKDDATPENVEAMIKKYA